MQNSPITKDLSREFAPARELSQEELDAVTGGMASSEVTYTHTFGFQAQVKIEVTTGR